MALMDDAARAVAEAAGWKKPEAEAGVFRFQLQGGLDFAMFSPDGRVCVVRGDVGPVPAGGPARDDALADAARRQVGASRRRASVLAVEKPGQGLPGDPLAGERLILFRQIRMAADAMETLAVEVRDFLNDLAWWRASLDNAPRLGASPFSFSMNGMGPSGGQVGMWMGGLR